MQTRSQIQSSPVPVTVFTGFLGSGKTTIILSLLPRVPKGYKLCLLKNEFGDIKVDSELAQGSDLAVQEMLNGCLCCVLVGQMKLALMEIKDKYNPDRIMIETSGSAFPAPIAWQIREMKNEGFILDSIVTVVDCINFRGYEDTSYTAKMQAQYTDIILLNKHELVSERELDTVIDHINELNTDTPKVKCEGKNGVSPDLIFGIDTKLFDLATKFSELIDPRIENHHQHEIDLIQVIKSCKPDPLISSFTKKHFEIFLESLSNNDIYRLKGFVRLTQESNEDNQLYIVNHAFGRYTLTPIQRSLNNSDDEAILIKITIMGVDLKMHLQQIKAGLCINDEQITLHFAH
ncbi:CobW/HypB/UreG, nucleotide-binding domain-containing protein [Glomus cerebriforme]|uniref:CobW/HypB/UreG, nucleotide-binding domain-containing protein n=1 Tax=Glomus cerebriforme TaxID=658196 RepID=A0A397THP1_9GLOM|nr:CobW/HypB/UreG, nucleotide-binding domain-containing protein [Glomus cerebriforme]